MARLAQKHRVINQDCRDISKRAVGIAFAEAFGYPLALDPRQHYGQCVQKSDNNAAHDGQIIQCPTETVEHGFVYQKAIDNELKRVLSKIFTSLFLQIASLFVYLKYREISVRFANANDSAEIAEISDFLSAEEQKQILSFCRKIGLEYGELDVLRDKHNHRIYIVDANPTPWGPPNHIDQKSRHLALEKLAAAFASMI